MSVTVEDTVKAAIHAQVVAALTKGPDLIEQLVTAAFAKKVDENGKPDGYGAKISYLDWLVADRIREAARSAVNQVVTSKLDEIKALVAAKVTEASIEAAAEQILGNFRGQDWRITVNFGANER